jgi:hypothetical protein
MEANDFWVPNQETELNMVGKGASEGGASVLQEWM